MSKNSYLFVNTFEPVVPLYRDVFPLLQRYGASPMAMISACQYRSTTKAKSILGSFKLLWVPNVLKKQRRLCAIFYWLMAPFILFFASNKTIVFLTQPPLFYILGAWIARVRNKNYCIHIMDLYPDLLLDSTRSRHGLISKILCECSRRALLGAKRVIVIGRCMKDVVCSKGVDPDRVIVVENWPERSVAESKCDGSVFRKKYNLTNKFLIVYSGNMGRYHNFDSLLNVALRLKDRSDVAFVFVGQGVRRHEIENIAKYSNNLLILDYQNNDDFADILSAGDVHFVSLRACYEGLMVPSKFYSILAAGRPVIYEGSARGEIARVINEEECGLLVTPNQPDDLESAIIKYVEDSPLKNEHGRRSRRAYLNRFDRSVLAERYVRVMLDI